MPADLKRGGDQRVVAEQVADDPQIELARDVLGVLEPVLELAVAGDVGGIVEVQQQVDLARDLRPGWIRMKPDSMCRPSSTPPPIATSAS